MEIGDIVNIKGTNSGYWKGKIVTINDRYDEQIRYSSSIITVKEINGESSATVSERDLEFDNEISKEWYEVRR